MLTEKEVLEQWIEYCLPGIRRTYEQGGNVDRPARRESWSNFIDYLNRDGQISDDMAYNIDANVCDL